MESFWSKKEEEEERKKWQQEIDSKVTKMNKIKKKKNTKEVAPEVRKKQKITLKVLFQHLLLLSMPIYPHLHIQQ